MSAIYDRDPEDENVEHLETGLCVNPWCEDAALPDEEFCRDCFLDALALEAELLGDDAA